MRVRRPLPSVETSPLGVPSPPRIDASSGSRELAQGLGQAAGAFDRLARQQEAAREDANAIKLTEAEAQLGSAITTNLHGVPVRDAEGRVTGGGVLNLHADDAIARSAPAYQELLAAQKQIAEGLPEGRTREIFVARTSKLLEGARGEIETHVAKATDQVDTIRTNALKDDVKRRLSASPDQRELLTTEFEGPLRARLQRQGITDPGTVDAALNAWRGEANQLVIERLISRGRYGDARTLLADPKVRPTLGEHVNRFEKELTADEQEDEGARRAREIVGKYVNGQGRFDAAGATDELRRILAGPVIPPVPPGGTPHDLTKPILRNPDGSWSTESTATFEFDGRHLVLPTIVDGKRYTPEQAAQLYREGKNKPVGDFDTAEAANAYAEQRHLEEQALRSNPELATRVKKTLETEYRIGAQLADAAWKARVGDTADRAWTKIINGGLSLRAAKDELTWLRRPDVNEGDVATQLERRLDSYLKEKSNGAPTREQRAAMVDFLVSLPQNLTRYAADPGAYKREWAGKLSEADLEHGAGYIARQGIAAQKPDETLPAETVKFLVTKGGAGTGNAGLWGKKGPTTPEQKLLFDDLFRQVLAEQNRLRVAGGGKVDQEALRKFAEGKLARGEVGGEATTRLQAERDATRTEPFLEEIPEKTKIAYGKKLRAKGLPVEEDWVRWLWNADQGVPDAENPMPKRPERSSMPPPNPAGFPSLVP